MPKAYSDPNYLLTQKQGRRIHIELSQQPSDKYITIQYGEPECLRSLKMNLSPLIRINTIQIV